MDFSNHSRGQKIEEDDAYMKDIKEKMNIKRSRGIMEDKKMAIYYQDVGQTNDSWISYRLKHTVNFWSFLLVAVATSKTVYKPSVKFIRNHLHLQGFLNINMAATPFIMISTAISCGIFQGFWNVWEFEQELESYKN